MPQAYRKQQITLPGLSFKDRTHAYVKILSKMHQSERVDTKDDGRKAATICKVIDLQTAEMCRLICPALMVSALIDTNEAYVGKCYEIVVSSEKVPGKDYKSVRVYEIEEDADYAKMPNGTQASSAPEQT